MLLALATLLVLATGCERPHATDAIEQPRLVGNAEPRPVLPFSPGRSIEHLGGDTLLLVDEAEAALVLHDLGSGGTRRFGREGDGPGELRIPASAHRTPAGNFVVTDVQLAKVERWNARGERLTGIRTPQVPRAIWSVGDELLMVGAPFTPGRGPTLFRLAWDGSAIGSWDLFRLAPRLAQTSDGRPPSVFLSVGRCADGSVVAGNGAEYVLARVDSAGALIATFGRPELPPLVASDEEIRRRQERVARAAANMPPAAREAIRKLDRRMLEAPRPHFGGPIATDRHDRLWIITNRNVDDSTAVDLFACASGTFLGTVMLRDKVMALAPSDDRLFALVRRAGAAYLDQSGIDEYDISALAP